MYWPGHASIANIATYAYENNIDKAAKVHVEAIQMTEKKVAYIMIQSINSI